MPDRSVLNAFPHPFCSLRSLNKRFFSLFVAACLFCINSCPLLNYDYTSKLFFALYLCIAFPVVLFALYLLFFLLFNSFFCAYFSSWMNLLVYFCTQHTALTHSQAFRKDSFAVLLSVSDLLQHPPSSSLLGIGFREMHSRGGAVFYQRTNEQVREMLCQVVVENVGPEAQNRPKLARVRLLCFIFRWILHELYRKRPIGFFPLFLRCSFVPRTPFFSTFNKSLAGRLPPEETNRLRILACFFSARENYHDDDL